jgi:hypothetical protein
MSEKSGPDEMREFLLVVRRALLLIVSWIEKRYGLNSRDDLR